MATALSSIKDIEKLVAQAAVKAESRDFAGAFQLYVKATQSYIHISRTLSASTTGLSESDVTNLKARCKDSASKTLERATMIKKVLEGARTDVVREDGISAVTVPHVVRDRFSPEEQFAVIDGSSRINNTKFLLWTEPDEATFQAPLIFSDAGQPSLAQTQEAKSAQWKHPQEVLGTGGFCMTSPNLLVEDIIQGVVTDCSLVAGLQVCWDHHQKFGSKLALSSLYPQDDQGMPIISKNGKYCAKIWFNGANRMVMIDSKLPFDSSGSLVCASDQSGMTLWPSLLEKAYMKLMGGYDFPGSNSSIDLHSVIQWIPEYISFRSGSFRQEKTWHIIFHGFSIGQCLVTVGTGAELTQAIPHLNFVSFHNYAVTGMEENGASRRIKIVNPWKRQFLGTSSPDYAWVDWETVCIAFEGLYLNWDPGMFSNTEIFHGSWAKNEDSLSFSNYPLRLRPQWPSSMESVPREVWFLLTQHITSTHQPKQFITLSASQSSKDVDQKDVNQNAYSDSPSVLTKILVRPGDGPLILIASRDADRAEDVLPLNGKFTVAVYSPIACQLEDPYLEFTYPKKIHGSFTTRNAGGNSTFRTFMNNPQYKLRILPPIGKVKPKDAFAIKILLEGSRQFPINIKVIWSDGQRVTVLRRGDIAADSGAYNYGTASIDSKLQVGKYTLVLSTFEPKQLLPYTLSILCETPIELETIPCEGAGLFLKLIKGTWSGLSAAGNPAYGRFLDNPKHLIEVPRSTSIMCRLQLIQSFPRAAIALAIFEYNTDAEMGRCLVDSGPYSEDVCGVTTTSTLVPGPASYIIVPSTFEANTEASYELFIYSSSCPVELGHLSR
ncbi:cysteine protease [Tulasnella sp. 419]|nr:cysteine protease [Tulasnella sp. 419]